MANGWSMGCGDLLGFSLWPSAGITAERHVFFLARGLSTGDRGDFSLVTGMLNAPEGVNLLCNASLIGLGLMFAPVTLAFGAPVTFSVLVGANLAATGQQKWVFDPFTAGADQSGLGVNRGVVYWEGERGADARILVGAGYTLFALDAATAPSRSTSWPTPRARSTRIC